MPPPLLRHDCRCWLLTYCVLIPHDIAHAHGVHLCSSILLAVALLARDRGAAPPPAAAPVSQHGRDTEPQSLDQRTGKTVK